MPENLYEFRRNGENEDTICILIQKKLTKVFITYINKKIFYLDSKIKQSIYETNQFLIKKCQEMAQA